MNPGRHQPAVAAGDAIGANVTMLTLVLGLVVVLQPFPGIRRLRPYAAAAWAASALVALLMAHGTITRVEGALLMLAYVGFVGSVLVREHGRADAGGGPPPDDPGGDGARAAGRGLLALGGLAVVVLGGWLAVEGAEHVVVSLGFAESGVGLTLVAFATSAELLALLWAARRRRITELALAALVGSVVGNATATLGIAALARPLRAPGVAPAAWLPVVLSALLLVPGLWRPGRAQVVGGLLVCGYVAFVFLALR